MATNEQVNKNTLKAIALVTAWASEPSGGSFAEHVGDDLVQSVDDAIGLINGLVTVAGWTLVKLENATGIAPEQALQDIALKVQRRE